ncbi:MAG: peptidase C25, partial [Ulvibacter sp.]|nr:peptidase C25 [Ulvibacter sp.]
MKHIFLFLGLLICSTPAFSQTKNVTISWENEISRPSFVSPTSPLVNSTSVKKSSKQMAFERLKLTLTKEAIDFSQQWKDNGFANPATLKVTNVEYDAVSSKELELVSISDIPKRLQSKITSKKGRDQIYTIVSLSPLVNLDGQIKKVRSFSLSYKYFQNTNSKSLTIPISNSVLATGDWYKFKVEKTGVHLITKGFLDNLGINTATVDPRSIKIYGHGGKPLPLLNSKNNTLFDLPQNSIQVIGQEDGSFDATDQILFYGISTLGYDKENDTHINPYSDQAFYYITYGGDPGLRISPLNEPTGPGDEITTFNDYQFHEVDDFSPAKVGRRWFGNRFDIQDDQSYAFEFPNIVLGSDVEVNVNVASASESATSMAVSLNGTAIDPINFGTISGSTLLSYRPSSQNSAPYIVPASGETVTVNLLYNNGSNPSSIGYLDYIRVGAERQLIAGSEQFSFRYNLAATNFGIGEYSIASASQISQVWDVTNTTAIAAKANNEALNTLTFKAELGSLREYVAVSPQDYYTPVSVSDSSVQNQNIKGTIFQGEDGNFQDIDYLIITAPFLLQPAQRLAQYHIAQ